MKAERASKGVVDSIGYAFHVLHESGQEDMSRVLALNSGFEGTSVVHEATGEQKMDFENIEDEKRTRMGSLKKKALSASYKFKRSLKRRGRRKIDDQFVYYPIEDVRNEEQQQAADAFRQMLKADGLVPPQHDDYRSLLRFLKARKFDVEKEKVMRTEMLNWRRDFGTVGKCVHK